MLFLYFILYHFCFPVLNLCIIFCIHLCVTSLWNLVDFAAVCLGQDTLVKDIFNLKSHIFLGKQRLKTVYITLSFFFLNFIWKASSKLDRHTLTCPSFCLDIYLTLQEHLSIFLCPQKGWPEWPAVTQWIATLVWKAKPQRHFRHSHCPMSFLSHAQKPLHCMHCSTSEFSKNVQSFQRMVIKLSCNHH